MKRKIEKYLAKKQAVDVANIRFTEDGRFDFMGDLDGVLAAVRGKEGPPRSRTKSEKKPLKQKKKRDLLSSNGQQHHHMPSHGMHPPPHPMYSYPHPYMHGMHGPPPLHHNAMSIHQNSKPPSKTIDRKKDLTHESYSNHHDDKENFPSTAKPKLETYASSPPKDRHGYNSAMSPYFGAMTPGSTMKTPFAINTGDFPSKYFENTPRRGDDGSLQDNGMTPLTDFRESFTPFAGDGMFSLHSNGDLSKTLFADDSLESILKTPTCKSVATLRIRIGGAEKDIDAAEEVAAQFRRQVTISPISDTVQRSKRYTDDLEMSVSFAEKGSGKRKRHFDGEDGSCTPAAKNNLFLDPQKSSIDTPLRDITMETADSSNSASSPFDPAAMMQTPGTADSGRNSSFWTHQLGFSPTEADFTPFRSPNSELAKFEKSKLEENASPKRLKLEASGVE